LPSRCFSRFFQVAVPLPYPLGRVAPFAAARSFLTQTRNFTRVLSGFTVPLFFFSPFIASFWRAPLFYRLLLNPTKLLRRFFILLSAPADLRFFPFFFFFFSIDEMEISNGSWDFETPLGFPCLYRRRFIDVSLPPW